MYNIKKVQRFLWKLRFNQYSKSDKAPFVIYADLEFLIEKTDVCKNNPENHPQQK